jgi:glutamate-5-semialdehyde dehydrogenase
LDRLKLDMKRCKIMSDGLRQVAALADPVGLKIESWTRPNGMQIEKVLVPIGVIAIIYESRPNVTVDAASLCFKSGNAVVLRGGSEALYSNLVLGKILSQALSENEVDPHVIQLIETKDREAVNKLLKMSDYIDLVIPRGGEGLIRAVAENSRIPVIKHYKGICHVFVDDAANLKMAEEIVLNSKTQRPATCNAMETLLIHVSLKKDFLKSIVEKLKVSGVEIRGCPVTCREIPDIKAASEEDWYTEYLDMILSVKIVKDVHEAVEHINHYGSMHSDSIVTENLEHAKVFLEQVDASAVYHNVSTRFTDGYEFGFGAEIGISTDKIHARGPMGLKELTSYKYVVRGTGQLRT